MRWRIERLSAAHDCRGFRCGRHRLDNFLARHALTNDRRGLGRTYVAAVEGSRRVVGYITLCSSAVDFEHLPERDLPRYPIPAILVARLAVSADVQGRSVGTDLMLMALDLAVAIADRLGVFAVAVEALDAEATRFYRERFGFTALLDDPRHLYVTVADLRASGIGG